MRRALLFFILLTVAAVAIIELAGWTGRHPQDLPWTRLRLGDPPGRFTAEKLAALRDDPAQCLALLAEAGAADRPAAAVDAGPDCRFDDAVRILPGGSRKADFRPASPLASCPLAAGLLLWDRDVLQPAAHDLYGERAVQLLHAGTLSCRRLYGRKAGAFSEHATANAIDLVGVRLAGGRTILVGSGWRGGDPRAAAFLHRLRDGACGLFTTTLSPDYNKAHRGHFHLDLARHSGWSACR
ncbi:extensin family protein [Sphingomonas ginkgonis]|uniref:Extensin family protein n=1 Tax=Sphingomonas ginkgonis TaxID=2315330 RepID=A0A3R9YMK1_9SPHN|nr:extensin family protein [Sphingomonas ginkgonis]RST30917.1 extensin family protein [Sphingomonas ginkgonis]